VTATMPDIDPLSEEAAVGRGGVPRDQYDRALLVPPEGGERRPYTSMSTLAKQLGSEFALHRWELRNVAKGVGMSRELSGIAGSSRYDTRLGEEDEGRNKEEGLILDEVVFQAKELAGAHQKARWGTAFHRYVEQEDPLGEPPEDMEPDIEAFRRKLKLLGIKILDTEVFVVNEELGACGSFDYLFMVPWRKLLVIGDSKTGKLKLDQDEIQLWGYAGSVIYDRDTDERMTFAEKYGMEVDPALGYTVHTAAMSGETDLWPLDLISGRDSANLAAAVHRRNSRVQKYYRKVKKAGPIDAVTIAQERAREAIGHAEGMRWEPTRARLKEIAAEFKDVWTNELTDLGTALLRRAKAKEPTS
jgi:hypothetical protein